MRLRLKQQRLLELMAASALSQNHWALKLGLSRGHWSAIVNGKHAYPSAKTRTRMLETFGVSVTDLFELEAGMAPWGDTDFKRAIADRYLIDSELGQGGMGAVYLARDVRHGRVVAVKVISPEAVGGIGLAQFHREIATIAQLQHPNILPLHDSGDAAGHPFFVMPWIREGSLRARLGQSSRLTLAESLPLVRGIAQALHHAHAERVLHCDIKPENVLLHGHHAWVMDFGIARKLRSEIREWSVRRELDLSAGTPAYVSPEQAAGDTDLDPRSDVYSLGCMVFEMLSGRAPFGGTNTQEIVASRFIAPPPPLRDLAPEVPAAVAATLERAMSLPRERRQPDALAFVKQLEHGAAGVSRIFVAASVGASRALAGIGQRVGFSATRPSRGLVRDLLADIRMSGRTMRRSPAFALTVILTLGVALGANATMFGIVDRLLLRSPPHIHEPELVHRFQVARWFTGTLADPVPAFSYGGFADLRDRTRSFSGVAAFDEVELTYGRGREGRVVDAVLASGQYFPILGARPSVGRFFGEKEDRLPSGERVVVLANGFWRSAFGGDVDILGRSISLDGRSYDIIGVAPAGFTGTELRNVDVWVPLTAAAQLDSTGQPEWLSSRGSQFLRVIARLRDGVTEAAASDDAARAYREGHADYQEYEAKAVASLAPLTGPRDQASGSNEARVAGWLFGMAVIVLLIASANVANLVLARGLARRGEIAVRRALGGTGGRLLRQFATESLVLAMLGCVAGLAVAQWGADVARGVLLPGMTWDTPPLDGRVLVVTALAALLATVLGGVLPLLRVARTDVAAALHGASRGSIDHPRRMLGALLVVQAGLSMVLLIGAGLFVLSLHRIQSLDLGFEPRRLMHARVDLAVNGATPPEIATFFRNAAERIRGVPGVAAAGTVIGAPFMGNYAASVRMPGMDSIPRQTGGGPYYVRVGAGALEALGVRLLRGRLIRAEDDRPGAPLAVVVTDRMARTLWPDRDPLGQCLVIFRRPCAPVVGVVADLHRQRLREPPFFLLFVPLAAMNPDQAPEALLLSVAGPPDQMVEVIRRELLAIRGDLPYIRIEPYEALIDPQARSWRLGATMFTSFGVLSLIMAVVGVYGVLSFSVTQRMPELGIRAALGASPRMVLHLVLAGGLAPSATGVILGSAASVLLSGRLEPLLFETSARDPVVFATAAAIILTFALAAALLPGLRAARVDPLLVLRAV